jgi:CubicO group peptidase (beta-lactamase class C family)
MRTSIACSLCALLVACAAEAPPLPPPPAAPAPVPAPPPLASADAPAAPVTRQLADDTTLTTASGATFTAPKGWWVTQNGGVIVLEEPDRKLKATLVEMPEADALKAIDAGWQIAEPGFALKRLHEPQHIPPIRGWDSVTDVDYETKAEEHRVVFAEARRYGSTTYVSLVDADDGAMSRRGPQFDVAEWTLFPPGMHEESFVGKTPRRIDDARAKELDAFIEQARAKLDVTGVAVAVVEGGKVVYEKGFGVRALGKKEPVTPNTLFMMGSITKSMTTMMEATLVDAGLFKWDTPVTTLLPGFALGDADTTSKLVLWETACACTGMPRRDMEFTFEYAHVTPEQRIASMKTMKPTTGFGETFQYSNLMVAAGGYAAAHAYAPKRSYNDAYGQVMQDKIFGPIGMKSTTFDFAAAQRADHAMPHGQAIDGTVHPLPLAEEDFVTPVRPAGASWSNLKDMERYVMTEMAKGVTPEGKRVVSEASLLERRKPRVRGSDVSSYGLGLEVGTFRDLPMLTHDGGTFGFNTMMFMLPDQGVAIIALTNVSGPGGALNQAIHRKVIEEIFEGAKPLADLRLQFYADARRDDIAKTMERVTRDPDPAWLAGLAGTYTNDDLGKVTVTVGPKGGRFDAGEWGSAIGQKRDVDGSLKVVLIDPPNAGLELIVGGDDPAHRTLTLLDDQVKYVFTRVAGK